jgi:tripartite ATP-independent transporter DctM subunit
MDPLIVGLLGIVGLFALLFIGMPIGFALALMGFLGVSYLTSMSVALPILAMALYGTATTYAFTVIPLFIIMGEFAATSGLSQKIYEATDKWLRRLPGGVGLGTIGACAAFAAICGSSVATAATMGRVALPEMRRYNYDVRLATGIIVAGGTLGFLIPPSVGFVVYGILTGQSVGKLLISGFFPGFLLAMGYMVTVVLWVKLNPGLAPASPGEAGWKEKLLSLGNVWELVVVFILMMGGIYLGFFTPTEAGAVGAAILFFAALIRRKLNWSNLSAALKGTTRISVMLFVILAGAHMFTIFLALSGVPMAAAGWLGGLGVSRYVIFAMIIIVYLLLGCFLDAVAMMVLTLPVIFPTILALGFDPIWFGVIAVLMMNAGLITPPLGLNIFVVSEIAQEPAEVVFRGTIRFLVAILVVVVIVTVFPQVALFLPGLM